MGAPDAGIIGARFEAMREQWRWLAMPDGVAPTGNLVGPHSWTHTGVWGARTVIPTDEQGNPVSWEAAGFAAEAVREAQESMQQTANETPARSVGDIEWTVTGQPDMTVEPATGMPDDPTARRLDVGVDAWETDGVKLYRPVSYEEGVRLMDTWRGSRSSTPYAKPDSLGSRRRGMAECYTNATRLCGEMVLTDGDAMWRKCRCWRYEQANCSQNHE